jgi:uroporphyrin-III C-methyltransferase / precorrin-2 dehydrogenase / sirohydrochlorin ferrochelatase
MTFLPITLKLAHRTCFVIGEGDIAEAKARLIEAAGGLVIRLQLEDDIPTVSVGALAFVIPEPEVDLNIVISKLHDCSCLVNVADKPELCDFLLPAYVERGPLIVAISTGGKSATVARQVRTAVEAMLPQNLGDKVLRIAQARPEVAKVLNTVDARRRFWDRSTRPGAWGDPLSDGPLPSLQAIVDDAEQGLGVNAQRILTLIELRSTDPDDISLSALRLLQRADAVIAIGNSTVIAELATRVRRDAALVKLIDWSQTVVQDLLQSPERAEVVVVSQTVLPAIAFEGWTLNRLICGSKA